jgi:hypothetical protein
MKSTRCLLVQICHKKAFLLFVSVELAAMVQKADEFTRATAGSKLSIIAEQVPVQCRCSYIHGTGTVLSIRVPVLYHRLVP